jgi:hypothetical protein
VRLSPDLKEITDSLERDSKITGAELSWGSGFWLRRR